MATDRPNPKADADWRPGDNPVGGRRRQRPEWAPPPHQKADRTRTYQRAGLGLLAVGLVLVGVYLYRWLMAPHQPVLIVITANPNDDATRLDAPIDPYGWLGGERLLKWAAEYNEQAPPDAKKLAPKAHRVKADREVASLADEVASNLHKAKTAFVYVGLHTGADGPGKPFVYAAGGTKLSALELLKKLSAAAAGKRSHLVVLFDNGRLPPKPEYGHLEDGFAREMKALEGDIAKFANLTVILGAGEGERGWESEEWKTSALVRSLVKGLSGVAKSENYIGVGDLFGFIAEDLRVQTLRTRPTAQKPFRIPADRSLAELRYAPAFSMAQEAMPEPHDPLPLLTGSYQQAMKLAGVVPAPAVYSPRSWKRYRELLLRSELVARAGAKDGGSELDQTLAKLKKEMEVEARFLESARLPAIKFSKTASTAMWAASGDKDPNVGEMVANSSATVKAFAATSAKPDLIGVATPLRQTWTSRLVRPPDVQLVLMLDQFFGSGELTKDPLPAGPGQHAVRVRQVAEDAALGRGRIESTAHPYSEAVWVAVRERMEIADAVRRRAEDGLFGPAKEVSETPKLFTQADDGYKAAQDRAGVARKALELRDEVYADLPYLGRWLAGEGMIGDADKKEFDQAAKLWPKVHTLADLLDLPRWEQNTAKDLAEWTEAVESEYRPLRKLYDTRLAVIATERRQQLWAERERLLAVPLLYPSDARGDTRREQVIADRRRELVTSNRDTTQWLEDKGLPSVANDKYDHEVTAVRLRNLVEMEIGPKLLEKLQNNSLVKPDAAAGWVAEAYRAFGRGESPKVSPDDLDPWGERYSRLATGANRSDGPEPAQRNRDWRWRRLLTAQARRAVLDHWYDGRTGTKYFDAVSKAYLDDADALAPPGSPKPDDAARAKNLKLFLGETDAEEFRKLRNADKIVVSGEIKTVRWTSEREQTVRFPVTAGTAGVVPPGARVTTWADGKVDPAAFAPGQQDRRLVDNLPDTQLFRLTSKPKEARINPPLFGVTCRAFFRGQAPHEKSDVSLAHVPDIVYSHGPPPTEAAAAFIGSPNTQPGALAIVLDYSPSMDWSKKDGKFNKDAEDTRLKRAFIELEKVLAKLPNGTRISVRGFGVEPDDAAKKDDPKHYPKLDYEVVPGIPTVTANTADRNVVYNRVANWQDVKGNLGSLMKQIREFKRGGDLDGSPIVRTMVNAADKDFDPRTPRHERVLLVITDGEDNSHLKNWNKPFPPASPDHLAKLKGFLKDFVRERVAVVHVVMIDEESSADTKATFDLLEEQFKGALQNEGKPWGTVERAKTKEKPLEETITALLRPKVYLASVPATTEQPGDLKGLPLAFATESDTETATVKNTETPRWPKDSLRKPGLYAVKVNAWPNVDPNQPRITFSAGDRILVQQLRQDVFKRVNWGEFLRPRLSAGRQLSTADRWLTTVAGYRSENTGFKGFPDAAGRHSLDVLLAAELPLAEKNLASEVPLTAANVQQLEPDFAWWEVTPGSPLTTTAALHVWREYGHPAPTWRLRRWDWLTPDAKVPPATVTGWVVPQKTLKPFAEGVPADDSNKHSGRLGAGTWTATVSREQHGFVPLGDDNDRQPEQERMVVRVYTDPPQPVFARLRVGGNTFNDHTEHQFYLASGAYTGYFDGVSKAHAKLVTIDLFSVPELKTADRKVEFSLPPPGPDHDWPNRINP